MALGACTIALTAALIVGQELGLEMSMWVGNSTFTAITVPKIGVGAGYALMGLEGVRGLNEISRIGSGQNWILEQVFGGNEEAYTITSMLVDIFSMGYMQVGMDNIALDRNRSQKETNIKEKVSWVNTEADLDLPDIQIHRNVDTKEKNYEILASDGETVYLSKGGGKVEL